MNWTDDPRRAVGEPASRASEDRRGRGKPAGAGLSDIGLVRGTNEDAILVDPSRALFAVADGMGGHNHGEIAARLVIAALAALPAAAPAASAVVGALQAANASILDWAVAAGAGQIGATAVVALVGSEEASIAWAGDSRAYRWRRGNLVQVTRDHSILQELIDAGRIGVADAASHPEAHVITRAVGAAPTVEIDVTAVSLQAGDVLLLCSDGLSGCVSDRQIAACIETGGSPETMCSHLLDAALANGGPDNISIVAVLMEADDAGA